MKQQYLEKRFHPSSLAMIDVVNQIIAEYQADNYVLTVRQLYYQLVARDIIANNLQEYKRIASLINDGKMAGLIDWDAIEDRTRDFLTRSRWTSGASIIRSCALSYHEDMWANQEHRLFVIIEKEALVGVFERICSRLDVPLLAARGYPSGSVLREFAVEQIIPHTRKGQQVHILHFGDHDPSGIDMTRDLTDRLDLFSGENCSLTRLALNMAQIEELDPPENPAKSTDSRFKQYKEKFGDSSWELDALQPRYLSNLVKTNVQKFIDQEKWKETLASISRTKARLQVIADNFDNPTDEEDQNHDE